MKKFLSILLALVMVFSLLPINAFADIKLNDTIITEQPVSTTVEAGENAVFTISAINLDAGTSLKYLWYNASKVTTINKIGTLSTFLEQFDGAKLGE